MSPGMSLNSFCGESTLVSEKENIYQTQIANGIKKSGNGGVGSIFYSCDVFFTGMKQDL